MVGRGGSSREARSDGPRVEGGLRAAAWVAVAARVRRGARIWSITEAWVMHAIIDTR